MHILIIGGGGHLGRIIGPRLAETHRVTVADRDPTLELEWAATMVVDVLDQVEISQAVVGVDLVIYMAMGTKEGWGGATWARSQFDVNVTGLYNTLQVVAVAGVPRVILAGSMSVYREFLVARDESVPDAVDAYGLSKRLGEEVSRAAVSEHGFGVTVLRLVLPMTDEVWHASAADIHADVMTSASDTASAFIAAIDTELTGWNVFTITGDHAQRRLDWSAAQRTLGWQPRSRRSALASASASLPSEPVVSSQD